VIIGSIRLRMMIMAVRIASAEGYADSVELLLDDPRVNPAAMQNFALRIAAYRNRLERKC
jgi:hypothetical protein